MYTVHSVPIPFVLALFESYVRRSAHTTLCSFLLFIYSSEKAHRVMTCVRASNNETSPIQIWNCDQNDPQKVCALLAILEV